MPGPANRVIDSVMRLWSLHPELLDAAGLVALWREGLLARHVLTGSTRGYQHHPQLSRFQRQRDPVSALDGYLSRVYDESVRRNYRFSARKISYSKQRRRIQITEGQLTYEMKHLRAKLRERNEAWLRHIRGWPLRPHPCFRVVEGDVEPWEKR